MTFFEISVKLLQKNFNRCRLYVLCSFFAVTIFFCFAAIFTNPSFMEGQAVDAMVSSNIIFPSFLAASFLILFVPYSYSVFLSARKQEYGIMFSLGMSRLECLKCLLWEGLALFAIILAASFFAGTVLSFFFYEIISHVIGIIAMQWGIPYKAYAVTALFYGITLIITAAFQVIGLLRSRIRSLLLAPYQAERGGRGYQWLRKLFPNYVRNHLLEFSLLARHKKNWAVRYGFSALLVGSVLYLISFCAVLQSALLRDVENYCPYDLIYSEIFGQNHISEDELKDTLLRHDVSIEEDTQISYVRDAAFNYFAMSEVNEKLGCNYKVPEGTFLNLFQYEMEDGVEHDVWEADHISLKLDDKKELGLRSCGSDIRILFNKGSAQADYTLILNDADFDRIKSDRNYWFGTMHLIKLQDWKNSTVGIVAFQSFLQEANGLTPEEQWYFRAVSKIERFELANQSGHFAIFLLCFVEMLLLMAAYLLIYSGIAAEQEENSRLTKSLFLIGTTNEERFRLCLFKKRMRFLPPLMIALLISLPFIYKTGESVYHSGKLGCLAGTLAGLVLILLTMKFTKREHL